MKAIDTLKINQLGLTNYRHAWKLQRRIFSRRLRGEGLDTLLVTRHDPAITMGKSASEEDLLVGRSTLVEKNIDYVEIERGGGITYHGPGQVILYPVFDLRNYGKDLREFIRRIGFVMKKGAEEFGINVQFREKEKIGLWLEGKNKKLGSVGLHVKKWVTMHGIAFNVSLDKRKSTLIRPCGIEGSELVSLSDLASVTYSQVRDVLVREFLKEFGNEQKT